MAVIEELVAVLGFDLKNPDAAKRFQSNIDAVAKSAGNAAAAIGKYAAVAGAAIAAGAGIMGKSVIQTGAMFESLDVQLTGLMGTSEKAKKAMDWIRVFAQDTPLSLSETAQAFAMLKNYGIDPMSGAMQAAVDMNAKMGGNFENLMRIVMPMGQAWSLGKLQTQDMKQMIEVGVPVHRLLEEVTGVSGEALEKLISQGKLGKEVMTQFFEAMARDAAGSSAMMARTFNGKVARMGDVWEDFNYRIAQAGVFDAAKESIEGLMKTFEQWQSDGSMDIIAKKASDLITVFIKGFALLTSRIAQHVQVLTKNWEKLRYWVYAITLAMGALVVAAFPLTSLFAAISVALDDLFTYLEGGDSLIGRFIDKLKEFFGIGDGVAQAIAGIAASLSIAFVVGIKSLLKFIGRSFISLIVTAFKAAAPRLGLALLGPAGWAIATASLVDLILKSLFGIDMLQVGISWGKQILDGMWQSLKDIGDKFFGVNQGRGQKMDQPTHDLFSKVDALHGYRAPAFNGSSNQNVNINVNGVSVTNNGANGMPAGLATQIGRDIANGISSGIPPARIVGGG